MLVREKNIIYDISINREKLYTIMMNICNEISYIKIEKISLEEYEATKDLLLPNGNKRYIGSAKPIKEYDYILGGERNYVIVKKIVIPKLARLISNLLIIDKNVDNRNHDTDFIECYFEIKAYINSLDLVSIESELERINKMCANASNSLEFASLDYESKRVSELHEKGEYFDTELLKKYYYQAKKAFKRKEIEYIEKNDIMRKII